MRHEVYRVAYDEASAELSEILSKFDQLRLRKERIEKLVEALKPLMVTSEVQQRAVAPIERPAIPVERPVPVVEQQAVPAPAPAPSVPLSMQKDVDEAADPFSRRVENVMGMNSAARDVREYSRLFSSGTSRGN
ncbi:MAG TPA: hypothetical protein VN151_03530 [Terracidiphilus sp.]|nr:hypothetical protein [Terracidiphilus sp.]